MPRQMRVEYPGAIYHVMSRGDRNRAIYRDDVDRQDFLKTLAEACQKAGFQVHAYCLMGTHFHLVVETPNANLVAGMRWLLSTYTNRLNHRHEQFGHVFSGRYKALHVQRSGGGYLRTACDYVHLNPVRAGLVGKQDRLLAYPWSSWMWYMASPEHRPAWMRVDRLLGAHGIKKDTSAGRAELEKRMQTRRTMKSDDDEWKPVERGWCLGSDAFRAKLLERMGSQLGEHHSGELRRESAQARAERIIAEALKKMKWKERDLQDRPKGDPAKLDLARHLRKETTLTIRQIAERLSMGSWKSLNNKLYLLAKQTNTK